MKKIFSVSHNLKSIDLAILITRISIALLMLTHGLPKLEKFSENSVQFVDFFGLGPFISLSLAVFAEVICSIFILLGLATRLAIIPLSITMLVAILHVHFDSPFSKQEMAWHYLLVYVVLFILGSGKYSLDRLLFKKKSNLVSDKVSATT